MITDEGGAPREWKAYKEFLAHIDIVYVLTHFRDKIAALESKVEALTGSKSTQEEAPPMDTRELVNNIQH